ncbi:hypothetical protein [Nocardia grenadensis]|uniref:hypothetical protein n=1 Tax=Nocardia grenadensis TaxID=931537 RepID=UPI001C3FDFBE|nr:hypothetical protein [Nocardia grenadensis]
MGRCLILDTGVLIAYERETIDRTAYDDDDLAIAAATVAEFRVGIELADAAERAGQCSRRLPLLLADLIASSTPTPQPLVTPSSWHRCGDRVDLAAHTI